MKAPTLARRPLTFSTAVLVALLPTSVCTGQGLLGFATLPGQTNVSVVSVNPKTGALLPLLPTTATGITLGSVTFDPSTRRLFFEELSALHIADLRSGVDSTILLPQCCPQLQFDVTTNQLLGLVFLPGESNVSVVSVDQTTGALTPLLPTTATGITLGSVTFDPSTRRLFFEELTSLHIADLRSGVDSTILLPQCCPQLQFDVTTNQLLGLVSLPGESNVSVVSVDQTTGAMTPILPTTATGISVGSVTFDPSTRRLFFDESSSLHIADLRQSVASITPLPQFLLSLQFAGGDQVSAVPLLDWRGFTVLTLGLLVVGWTFASRTRG